MISNVDRFNSFREKRNAWFLESFPGLWGQSSFTGLDYFPYSSDLCCECDLIKLPQDEKAVFAVEGVGQIELRKYGFVQTKINDVEIKLYLYCGLESERPEEFIAPFKDSTNGSSTYGGGRNLDVAMVNGKALVDFNLASNFECAYSPDSICAMPLPENWLTLEIRAGEKLFKS